MSILKEDITIVNIYAPNIGAPQHIRENNNNNNNKKKKQQKKEEEGIKQKLKRYIFKKKQCEDPITNKLQNHILETARELWSLPGTKML